MPPPPPLSLPSPGDDPSPLPDAYARTAPAADTYPRLGGTLAVEVAVVGGGITGLSAALHLAEADASVAVLEQRGVGHGASGRAFGNVVPYAKHQHDHILKHFGAVAGQRIVDALAASPAYVYGLVQRHGIDCEAVQNGLIFAAHDRAAEASLRARADYWRSRGGGVDLLDAGETKQLTGTGYYNASVLDRRGGTINPLAYTRGLARAAVKADAAIFEETPVVSIERRGQGWRLRTDGGAVDAEQVLICTNAYTGGLHAALSRCFVPMRAYQLVSRPLSPNLLASILPGGQTLTDTRRLFSGVRVVAGGRLHVSADGPVFDAAAAPFAAQSTERIRALYPEIGTIDWEEAWTGWVAVTRDEYPRVHRLADGMWTAYGYSGRGIAFGTLLGRQLAHHCRGGDPDAAFFPVTPAAPIFGHALARPALSLFMTWLRWRDRRDLARAGRQ
jgi:glycine/D-amino acid oxidase-like deaminating enzyme